MKVITRYINIILILLILLENLTLCCFSKTQFFSLNINASALFGSSLLFAILILWKFYNNDLKIITSPLNLKAVYSIIACIITIIFLAFRTNAIYKTIPINPSLSDIIPAIQIVVKRFLAGEYPYSPMTALGYTTPVGYMPFHWLPFVFAEIWHIDYRWISFSIWATAIVLISYRLSTHKSVLQPLLILVLAAFAYCLTITYADSILGVTVEIMIAGYYILMITGLNQKKAILTGLLLSLCLLSRYSLIFWLPLWAFVLFLSGQRSFLYKTILVVMVIMIGVYIIPFLSKDWSVFY